MRPLPAIVTIGLMLTVVACTESDPETRQIAPDIGEPTLIARAILPADTFLPDTAPVGRALPDTINGRTTPFAHNPVQGLSSLVALGGGEYLALQDNGFGSRANSSDVPLMWYRLQIDLPANGPTTGHPASSVHILGHVPLTDPEHKLPANLPLTWPQGDRPLSGAELDPESFVRLPDGTVWLGEEFGPWLLHFSADGRLLEEPVDIPVVASLRPLARGEEVLRSPDHPDFLALDEDRRRARANLPRSGGIEGLAATADGSRLFVAVEKGLLDDEVCTRRMILEFDTTTAAFTGRHWFYRSDDCGVAIAALEAAGDNVLLVTERDNAEGDAARIKRIYRVETNAVDDEGYLHKDLVCDLLDIADPDRLATTPGDVGKASGRFTFPFVTPECLLVVDRYTLLVACDNNYPFSTGRNPPSTPDNTEFILVSLPRSLDGRGPVETP